MKSNGVQRNDIKNSENKIVRKLPFLNSRVKHIDIKSKYPNIKIKLMEKLTNIKLATSCRSSDRGK